MPLSGNSNYNGALGASIKEEWIFELRNNTYSSGSAATEYIRLATAEVGSGNTKYHSFITSTPTIRESIDLVASTSKNGNISISCVNGTLDNHSNATLAAEIYGGTRRYINRDVVVKSRVGSGFVDSGYNMGALDSTLTASSGDTSFEVPDTSVPAIFSAGVVIKINNEQMLITSVGYTPSISVTINVQRGYNGTTIAAHTSADVYVSSSYENTIYTGRLKAVSITNQDIVNIEISARTPIDFLKIPEYTSSAGNFFPILYGSGTPQTSKVGTPGTGSSNTRLMQYSPAKVFPVMVDSLSSDDYKCLAHREISGGSADGRLHYPIKDLFSSDGFPVFVPLNDAQNSTSNNYEGTVDTNRNVLSTKLDLDRAYLVRPVQNITTTTPNENPPNSTELAEFSDNDDSTSTTWSFEAPQGDGTDSLKFKISDIPKEEHEIQECKLYVKWGASNHSENSGGSVVSSLRIKPTYSGSGNIVLIDSESGNRTAAYSSPIDLLSTGTFSNANGQIPDDVEIEFLITYNVTDNNDDAGSVTIDAFDFYLEITTKITDTDNLANSSAVTGIKKLYTGADGLDKSFSSGAVTNVAEMHRDLIRRFAGITATTVFQSNGTTANLLAEALDNSETGVDVDDGSVFVVNDAIRVDNEEMLITNISSNTLTVTRGQNGTSAATHNDNAAISKVPENFTALNTARANWTVFYYLHKQKELLKVLEQTQKEGGFIFRFKANDGTPQYIYLVDSPSVNHTISKDDIKGTKISLTDFDSLITKRVIKYQKNPINDELLFEKTFTDTTNDPRGKYNVQSDENIATEDLEILNDAIGASNLNMGSGNKNDGYANYYNAIEGNPKILVETEIINPGDSGNSHFYLMEVGDICEFNHNNQLVAPFGESFSGKKFIVTSLTRSPGSLKVVLREI